MSAVMKVIRETDQVSLMPTHDEIENFMAGERSDGPNLHRHYGSKEALDDPHAEDTMFPRYPFPSRDMDLVDILHR